MKVALVTGAGKGLGRGFVEFLSENGFLVYAGVHHPTDTDLPSGPNVRVVPLDVQKDNSISGVVETISKEQGRLDLLVNNAALNKDSATSGRKELVTDIKTLDRRALLKMFDVNAISPLMVIKNCLGLMKADPCFIINISSMRASFAEAANDASANYGYKASKVALNMLSKSLLTDLPKNVFVMAVHPGGVHTNMNPSGALEPVKAAEKICKIIENWLPELNGQFLDNEGSKYPL